MATEEDSLKIVELRTD